MRINLQQMQLLCALFMMHSTQQHTAGLDAHHLARRQIYNGDQGLAQKLFRLIEGMDTAQNSAVSTSAIIQSKWVGPYEMGLQISYCVHT